MATRRNLIIIVAVGLIVTPIVAFVLAMIFSGPMPPTDSPDRPAFDLLFLNNFIGMLPWGLLTGLILSLFLYVCTCGRPQDLL